jgi:thiopeptide-type bacteriocin biosynthesis protein
MSTTADRRWTARHFFYHGNLDSAIRHFVRPALAELLGRQLADSFFFIRYTLGGPHIRLRLRLAPGVASPAAAIDRVVETAAARFLQSWPCETTLDADQIRRESRAILDAVPEEGELYYEPGSLVPFPFEPEVDRYGGPQLVEHSLDFFTVSSAQALDALGDPGWESPGRRGALAFRLLVRQAGGFARTEKELLSHLGSRQPVAEELGDAIWSKADRAFESQRTTYRALLAHELRSVMAAETASEEPEWPGPRFLFEASRRLSAAALAADPGSRWQIGHSQLHMTANRLGYFPLQEMHLQRILWRAAHDLREVEPDAWNLLMEGLLGREGGSRAPLSHLVEQLIRHLRESSSPSNQTPTGPPPAAKAPALEETP